MTIVNANGINLCYQFHGKRHNPVVLLVHGLGMPLTAWPQKLISRLVDAGFCVLCFDHRDVGESDHCDYLPLPNFFVTWLKLKLGFKIRSPYPLTDLMHDTVALLNALKIDKVHVVGVSMGGMIAQLLAINARQRIKTLTSIMSTSGNKKLPGPTKAVARHLLSKPASDSFADRQAYHLKTWQLIGSPKYPPDPKSLKKSIKVTLQRGGSPLGVYRQMLAILATPSRVKALQQIDLPTLVIHGKDDPLVPCQGGLDTASAIPNARLHLIAGMGHDLPDLLLGEISDLIIEQAKQADNALNSGS